MILLVLGGILEASMIGMLVTGDLAAHIPIFFLLFGIASLAYVVAIWQRTKFSMSAIIIFAVVFRLTLLLCQPSLSDDIYRYIWDGRVLASGINPYLFPPVSEHLVPLRDLAIYPHINHPHLPTLYPPAAQFFFLAASKLFGSVLGMKLMIVAVDLFVGWVLISLLNLEKKNPKAVLIYLWHPLVLVEGAGMGHMDFFGVAALMLAFWAWQIKRDIWALPIVGLAILVKFLPVLMVPSMVRWSTRWFPTNWKPFLLLPVVVLAGYMPFIVMDGPLWGSLEAYAINWEFNSPLFWILRAFLGDGLMARKLMGCLIGILVLAVALRRMLPQKAGFTILSGFMLLTPTLHPWYLIWLIPFLALNIRLAWIGFSLAVVLSYEVLIEYHSSGLWVESNWVWGLEFGTLLVLLPVSWIVLGRPKYCKS
jgi:hypothetical protein